MVIIIIIHVRQTFKWRKVELKRLYVHIDPIKQVFFIDYFSIIVIYFIFTGKGDVLPLMRLPCCFVDKYILSLRTYLLDGRACLLYTT